MAALARDARLTAISGIHTQALSASQNDAPPHPPPTNTGGLFCLFKLRPPQRGDYSKCASFHFPPKFVDCHLTRHRHFGSACHDLNWNWNVFAICGWLTRACSASLTLRLHWDEGACASKEDEASVQAYAFIHIQTDTHLLKSHFNLPFSPFHFSFCFVRQSVLALLQVRERESGHRTFELNMNGCYRMLLIMHSIGF